MRAPKYFLWFTLLLCLTSCGGGSGGGDVAPPPPVTITISPTVASVEVGDALQFSSQVNRSNFNVTWYVNDVEGGNATAGTITAQGIYTAPSSVPNPATVTVKGVPEADTTKSATAQVTISEKLAISPTAAVVPAGQTQQFTANKPADWAVNDVAGGNATVGTISGDGLYTAPASVPSPDTVTVKAAWQVNPAKTATATVTITAPSSVSISPTIVTVAAGTTQQFTASEPVDWQLSGAPGNNQPLGMIDASGLFTAPLGPPLSGKVTVTAISQADPGQQAIAIVTITFSNASLQGHYAFRFRGAAPDLLFVMGSFVADGMGGISDAVYDLNDLSSPVANSSFAASYSIGPDGRGTLLIVVDTDQIEWRLVMASPDSGRITAFGDGDSGSGSLERQDPSSFPTGILGAFAFAYEGVTTGNNPLAAAGMFTADAAGNITNGLQDINDNGTAAGNVNFTGTWGPPDASTGRGEVSLTINSQTANYAYYLLSSYTLIFSSLDTDKAFVGTALSQQTGEPYSNVSLMGDLAFVFSWGNPDTPPTLSFGVGNFTLDGNGTILYGEEDVDMFGGTRTADPFTGTYTIASNGQGYISMVRTGATDQLTLYMVEPNVAFFVTRDQFLAASGQISWQLGVPFDTSSVDGTFAFSLRGTQLGMSTDISGRLTFSGSQATVSGIADVKQSGSGYSGQSVTGTFTVESNGRGTAFLDLGITTSSLAIYPVDSRTILLIETDPTVPVKLGSALQQF